MLLSQAHCAEVRGARPLHPGMKGAPTLAAGAWKASPAKRALVAMEALGAGQRPQGAPSTGQPHSRFTVRQTKSSLSPTGFCALQM